MLVFRRKVGETVILDGHIEVQVLEITGTRVKLGFVAPAEVRVMRKELHLTEQENRRAAVGPNQDSLTQMVAALRFKAASATLGPAAK